MIVLVVNTFLGYYMDIPPSLSLSLSLNSTHNSGSSSGNEGGKSGGNIQAVPGIKKRQGVIWGKDIRHFEGDAAPLPPSPHHHHLHFHFYHHHNHHHYYYHFHHHHLSTSYHTATHHTISDIISHLTATSPPSSPPPPHHLSPSPTSLLPYPHFSSRPYCVTHPYRWLRPVSRHSSPHTPSPHPLTPPLPPPPSTPLFYQAVLRYSPI